MIYVMDACAMIAFLRQEIGAEVVESVLIDEDNVCFAHAINLCEVFYDFHKSAGESAAEKAISDLKAIGVIERNDFETDFWKETGRMKSQNKASLADCCAIVLANNLGGVVLTSDHHELDKIAEKGICRIEFIR